MAIDKKKSTKKRKQSKSPKRDHPRDEQVASATRTSSIASKSWQKKVKSKKLENNRTGT